ncbi:winged helix-turn-helix domain-containing protein [Kitasatospora sp. NPDC004240]
MPSPTAPTALLANAPAPGAQGRDIVPAWLAGIAAAGGPIEPFRLIADQLRREIKAGAPAPGTRLPSARQLQQRFEVASSTVQGALAVLKREGLVYSVQGRGSYVSHTAATTEASLSAHSSGPLPRRTASTITDDELSQLYERLAELESRVAAIEARKEAKA